MVIGRDIKCVIFSEHAKAGKELCQGTWELQVRLDTGFHLSRLYNNLLEVISMQAKTHLPNTLTVCYHSQYALALPSSKPFVQIVVVESAKGVEGKLLARATVN